MGNLLRFPNVSGHNARGVRGETSPGVTRRPKAVTVGVGDGTLVAHVDRYTRSRVRVGEVRRVTAYNQRLSLLRFADSFGLRPVERLGRSDVERWLGELDCSASTRRKEMSAVRVFCKWLVLNNVIKRDPTLGIRAPKPPRTLPRVLDTCEVSALLDVCPDDRARLIVLLMLQLGLRCVEVSRLEIADLSNRSIRVCGKGDHERVLPLLPEVRAALNVYLGSRGNRPGALIQNYQRPGIGLTSGTISHLLTDWMRQAGVKQRSHDGKSAHGLRRTCATDMVACGADIADVADALGHDNLASVRKYARMNTRRLEKAMSGRVYTLTVTREVGTAG